jgi:hypothetical protein
MSETAVPAVMAAARTDQGDMRGSGYRICPELQTPQQFQANGLTVKTLLPRGG